VGRFVRIHRVAVDFIAWFIWYPAAAAYTMGAAYQMEAIDRAAE
jgi:hypothetical protein